MAKIKDNPVESMRLDIEFADNGIILRNPDLEDEGMLALTKETTFATSTTRRSTEPSARRFTTG